MTKGKYMAPDGGWGWVIVLAFAMNNIVMIPIIQNFGMIYGNAFSRMGISATQSTIIMNINQAFGMILGMMNGTLLCKYGYRKMAVIGSLVYSSGVILTSLGSNFTHFVITYGMITSLGMSIGISAFSLAVNTYFKEKRARAMGLALTITGLGPIFVPHLTSLLLREYGCERTMFILGGLSLNSIAGALLLHPLKWHAKPVVEITENNIMEHKKNSIKDESSKNVVTEERVSLINDSLEKPICDIESNKNIHYRKKSGTMTISSIDLNDDNISIYGFEMPISIQNGSLLDIRNCDMEENFHMNKNEEKKFQRQLSVGNTECEFYKRSNSFNEMKARKFSIGSRYGDLSLSKKVLTEWPEEEGECTKNNDNVLKNGPCKPVVPVFVQKSEVSIPEEPLKKSKSAIRRIFKAMNKYFDLNLLCDPIYVNIMLGMSLAIFAEFNFSTLTPYILKDMHLTNNGIAVVMSSIATSDLALRGLSPYIGELLHKSPRIMYLFSLILLIITRSGLLFVNNFILIVAVAFGLGIAKGVRTVYMTLVIPSHVPLEKLANASSIQSLVNGFFLLVAGPFLGVIRDMTGSYLYCIIFINIVTSITIVIWLGEFTIKRIRNLRKPERSTKNLEQNVVKNDILG